MFYLLGAMIDPPTWLAAVAAILLLKRGPVIAQYLVSLGIYIAAILLIVAFAANPPPNKIVPAIYGMIGTVVWLSLFLAVGWAKRRNAE